MKNFEQQLLSGAFSGFASTISLQPFDLLKTRLQQGDGTVSQSNTRTLYQTTRSILVNDGMTGLWRGTAPSLARNVPGVALYMSSLTQLRFVMASKLPYFRAAQAETTTSGSVLPKLNNTGNLIAGAVSRVSVGFLLNPLSVLKARYESNMYGYSSLGSALGSIWKQGPSGLLRGFMASSLRDAPYAGLFVVFYEGLKKEAIRLPFADSGDYSAAIHTFAAASAGGLATIVTHPFDVIKTKVQVRSEDRYQGFARTVLTIWRQRGLMGFLDGASLRMSRKVLSSAIGWSVFESILRHLMPMQLTQKT
jgi:solute carrier family 25 protein 38